MSNAHKGSRLLLSGNIISVPFSSFHLNAEIEPTAIQYGQPVYVNTSSIYTMRPYEGHFGGGISIDQGTTNLNPYATSNAGGETPTNGPWGGFTNPTVETIPYPNPLNFSDVAHVSINYNGSGGGGTQFGQMGNVTCNANTTYTYSYYLKVRERDYFNGNFIYCYFYSGSSSTLLSQSGYAYTSQREFTGLDGWYRLWGTFTTPANCGNVSILHYAYDTAYSGNVNEFWFCGGQLEQSPFAHSFATTSRGMGKCYYPSSVLNTNSFTISGWFMTPYMHESSTGNSGISSDWYLPLIEFMPTSVASNSSQFGFSVVAGPEPSSWNRRVNIKDLPNMSTDNYGTQEIQDMTWYHLAFTFDGSNYKLYINGTLEVSIANSTPPVILSNTVLMIGGGYEGAPNTIWDEVLIDNYARSQEEIQQLFIANAPLYNPFDYRAYAQ